MRFAIRAVVWHPQTIDRNLEDRRETLSQVDPKWVTWLNRYLEMRLRLSLKRNGSIKTVQKFLILFKVTYTVLLLALDAGEGCWGLDMLTSSWWQIWLFMSPIIPLKGTRLTAVDVSKTNLGKCDWIIMKVWLSVFLSNLIDQLHSVPSLFSTIWTLKLIVWHLKIITRSQIDFSMFSQWR